MRLVELLNQFDHEDHLEAWIDVWAACCLTQYPGETLHMTLPKLVLNMQNSTNCAIPVPSLS